MNSNAKLVPSALGLVIGLWMIACGTESKAIHAGRESGRKSQSIKVVQPIRPLGIRSSMATA